MFIYVCLYMYIIYVCLLYIYVYHIYVYYICLLPAGSEERDVSRFGTIPVAILPSCQDRKTLEL